MHQAFTTRITPSIPGWPSLLILPYHAFGKNYTHIHTQTAHCLCHPILSLHIFLSCNSLVLLCLQRMPVPPQAMINVIGAAFLFLFVRSREAVGELWHKGKTDSAQPPPPHPPSRRLFPDSSRKGLISGVLISPRAGLTQPTGESADKGSLSVRAAKYLHTFICTEQPASLTGRGADGQ